MNKDSVIRILDLSPYAMKAALFISSVITSFFLTNCSQSMGPDYLPPDLQPPANYKNSTSAHHGISPFWWKTFGDPLLNSLQAQLHDKNLDLKAAYARRKKAFALLNISEDHRFPAFRASSSVLKEKNHQLRSPLREHSTQYNVGASLNYEIDLWGRVKRIIEASKADAAVADFTVADTRVALQTQLARNYFALRFLDAELASLREAVKVRKRNLTIVEDRLNAGIVTEIDTSRAKSELATAEAEILSITAPRAQLENAIAILLGTQPSTFRIPPQNSYHARLPSIPAGIPASLLYRRPDVVISERRLAASTARIGVSLAERYPKISLTGKAGLSSTSASKLLSWSNSFYSIGPTVSTPILQGRVLKSKVKVSEAEQREALAKYQKTTLSAFADVENALTVIQALEVEYAARQRAVDATTSTYNFSQTRYKEGISSYLEVVASQREQLRAQRTSIRTRGRQFAATVQLIQALGGGFKK